MPANRKPTAHVVGSINRDIVAFAPTLPKPGETILATRGAFFPGGKGANQAVAIARLGQACRMVGRVGEDAFGSEMLAFLTSEGVDTAAVVRQPGIATGFAIITVDARSENCITVVPGANGHWPDGLSAQPFAAGDVVVAQLEVPLGVVESAFAAARQAKACTVLNPAPFQPLPAKLLALTDVLILNETELAALADVVGALDSHDNAKLAQLVAPVLKSGPSLVIVTLGKAGASVHETSAPPLRVSGRAVAARDTTGAGDCFVGAFVARLLAGDAPAAAAAYANAAAAVSVTREGAAASYPYSHELHQST